MHNYPSQIEIVKLWMQGQQYTIIGRIHLPQEGRVPAPCSEDLWPTPEASMGDGWLHV